jgi:predicted DNA binding CopG/RHH family protein
VEVRSLWQARAGSLLAVREATFRKDRRLNIRLSSKDLEAIQKRALAEGLPYQTLIASMLHEYAAGRLKEI